MDFSVNTFTTSKNKKIFYTIFGKPSDNIMFFFHGFPGSGHQAKLMSRSPIFENRFQVIAIDRPGYGFSDPQLDLTLESFADIIRELACHLKIDKFISMGVSGGAPFATAVAHYMRDQVTKLSTVCGVAPLTLQNIKYLTPNQKKLALLARLTPDRLLINFFMKKYQMQNERFEDYITGQSSPLTDKDQKVISDPEVGPFLFENYRKALQNGPYGVITDMNIYTTDWGFDISDIACPHTMWHGDKDNIVHHGVSLSIKNKIPKIQLNLIPDEGHLSLPYNYGDQILKDLIR